MMFRRRTLLKTRRGGRRRPRRLRMESLEKRLPLAGNVTAAVFGGNLIINGDLDDNDITLDDDGAPGRVVITPNGTTTLNGVGAPQIFQATGDIRIRMRDGNDTVVFNGLGGSTPRDLMVDGGNGDNTFQLSNYTVDRDLRISNDDGFDTVVLDQVLARGISIDNGDGGGNTAVGNGSGIADDLRIRNRNGDNTIVVDVVGVGGDVTIRNGDGINQIGMSIPTIGDDLLITNGDGDVVLEVFSATVGDDMMVRNGNGFHDILLDVGTVGDDLNMRNGDGGGTIDIVEYQVGGNLNIRNGEATDTAILDTIVAVNICVHDGDGEGSFAAQSVAVGGDIMQSSGNGSYDVVVDDAAVGDDLSLRNRDGDNNVTVTDTEVLDDASIMNGDGDNTVTLGNANQFLLVGSRILVRNGNGDNTVSVDNTEVAQDLLIRNGNSATANSVAIGVAAGVEVGRDLQLISGEGDSLTTVNAVEVGEDLRLSTRGGEDTIIMTGTAVGDLVVNRRTSVETGSGEDSIEVGNDLGGLTVLADSFRLRMGHDADDAVIGEGTVMDILISSLDGGSGAPDVLTVVNGTAFDPFDPANRARLRNWELIF